MLATQTNAGASASVVARAGEIFLVGAHGEHDHFARHVEEVGVEAAEQGHRPFGQAGILDHQPFVFDQRQTGLARRSRRALADDRLALVLVDDHPAGAQFLDIVGRPAERDRAGVMEAVAERGGAGLDPVDRDRDDVLAEHCDDRVERPHPAELARSPAHRLGPGEIGDDLRDRLGDRLRSTPAGPVDAREPGAVAVLELVPAEPGFAQEALERLGRG